MKMSHVKGHIDNVFYVDTSFLKNNTSTELMERRRISAIINNN